jgi:hypothetical protein
MAKKTQRRCAPQRTLQPIRLSQSVRAALAVFAPRHEEVEQAALVEEGEVTLVARFRSITGTGREVSVRVDRDDLQELTSVLLRGDPRRMALLAMRALWSSVSPLQAN